MLITLEGIDGSGKSTQAHLLERRLHDEGYPVILVREPGGTELSERIRRILLDPTLEVAAFAEMLLFSAARTQLVEERIGPALAAGIVVVCDRFYDSTIAYQGGGRQLSELSWMREFQQHVTGGLTPDRTFLIEVDAELALKRREERSDDRTAAQTQDRIEGAGLAFQRDVAQAYAQLAEEEPARIMRLDGSADVGLVHAAIWDDVQRRLPETSIPPSGSPA